MTRRVSVVVDADINPFVRSLATGSAAARSFSKELESADGRLTGLIQTGLALAPAFVPLGAAAIPMLAGLTNQLGAAAAAAGVTLLAFQGVGDALTALNDYQIEPTEAHFKKLQKTMEALGPAGQVFVRTLQDLRPELQAFQDTAQQEMFPGLTKSINELFQIAPDVEHLIGSLAGTIGDLAADAGDGINDQRWVEFIGYLDREARPTLAAMGTTLGAVVEGLASMMMAFDPLADDFTQGMVRYAESFRDWADGLDDNASFQDFVDYIRQNGPEAMETLGALGDALVGLVTAAAPVGSAVLPVIEALADGLGAIADSSAGPLLVGAAAAVGTLGRSLAILRAVGLRGDGESIIGRALNVKDIKGLPQTLRTYSAATTELAAAERAAASAHSTYLGSLKASSVAGALIPGRAASENMTKATDNLVAANTRHAAAAKKAGDAEKARAAALKESISGGARAAGVVAGLALATSGYAEQAGLANTATFGLMGAIAGPYGVAAGTAIGLTMDLAGANNDLEQAIRGANAAMEDNDLGRMQTALADLDAQIAATTDKLGVEQSWNPFAMSKENIDAVLAGINELATGSGDAAKAAREELEDATANTELALNVLGHAFGALDVGEHTSDLSELNAVLTAARPAMDALGISVEDLAAAAADGTILDLTDQIQTYTQWAGSAEGRTQGVADAMAALDDDMISTADAADQLATSLEALFDPGLNLSEATDKWRAGLRDLKDALADKDARGGRSLTAGNTAGDENRAAVRDQVEDLQRLLQAQADTGVGAKQLARNLRAGRDAILDTGAAAGLSRKELRNYLNTLGLTPKVVRTLIDANTDPAVLKKRQLMAELMEVDKYRATPSISLDTSSAYGAIAGIRAAIASLSTNVTVGLNKMKFDTGGYTGPGGKHEVAGLVHRGEVVLDADTVNRDWAHISSRYGYLPGFADGGVVTGETAEQKKRKSDEEKRRKKAQEYAQDIRSADRDFGFGNDPTVASVRSEIKAFARDVREAGGKLGDSFEHLGKRAVSLSRAYEREDKAREKAREYRDEIRGQAKGSFNNDIFGGGLSDLRTQVEADTNDADAMDAALEKAAAKGLDGDFAAQLGGSGNLLLAQEIAGLSKQEIRQLEKQYIGRGTSQNTLGQQVVDMSGVQKSIDTHTRTMSDIDRRLGGMENRIEDGVYRGAKDGVEGKDKKRSKDTANRKRTR